MEEDENTNANILVLPPVPSTTAPHRIPNKRAPTAVRPVTGEDVYRAMEERRYVSFWEDADSSAFTQAVQRHHRLEHELLGEFTGTTGELQGTLQQVVASIATLTTAVQSTNTTITNLEKKMDTKITGLEKKVTGLEKKVTGLEKKMDTKITDLENKMDSKITGLEKTMDSKITGLEKKMGSKITGLEKKMDSKITDVKSKVTGLHERIDMIETTRKAESKQQKTFAFNKPLDTRTATQAWKLPPKTIERQLEQVPWVQGVLSQPFPSGPVGSFPNNRKSIELPPASLDVEEIARYARFYNTTFGIPSDGDEDRVVPQFCAWLRGEVFDEEDA